MKSRLLFFIPSLFCIVLVGFLIAVNAPGDPVKTQLYDMSGTHPEIKSVSGNRHELYLRHRLGLDLPLFYFSVHSMAEPDTLYKVYPENERLMMKLLVNNHGNWHSVNAYYTSLMEFIALSHMYVDQHPELINANAVINQSSMQLLNLKSKDDETFVRQSIINIWNSLKIKQGDTNDLFNAYQIAIANWDKLYASEPTWKNYIPSIALHHQNQFHRWLFGDANSKGVMRGDFGISYTTQRPVMQELLPKIKWSLTLSLLALIISLAVAIPVARYAVLHSESKLNRLINLAGNVAFAAPVFWLAVLLLFLFANPSVLKIFPASGVQPMQGFTSESALHRLLIIAGHLVLPLICYSYSSLALLAFTFKASLFDVMQQDYIRTAFAKGLSLKQAVNRHAMRNALLPLLTLVANFFPAALSGSVIIENIFSIPGMGNEIVNAVYTQNCPVIVAIVTITGFFTLTGYLIVDWIYTRVDPRIKLNIEN